MVRCASIKQDGERCGATAMRGYPTCYGHRPDLAEERRRNASRGGKSGGRGRGSGEITAIKGQLRELVEGVRSGRVDRGDAAVCGQLLNIVLRALDSERKIKETELLEERIAIVEERLSNHNPTGGYPWARS